MKVTELGDIMTMIYGTLGLFLGGTGLYNALGIDRTRMRFTPRRRPSELVEGQRVRMLGQVESASGDLLRAPFSGRPCIAYIARIRDRLGGSTALHMQMGGSAFWLTEEQGRVWVESAWTRWLLSFVEQPRVAVERLPAPWAEALRRHQQAQWPGYCEFVFEEALLQEGDRVAVSGQVRRDHDRDISHDYRHHLQGFRLDASDHTPLLVGTTREALRS